MLVPINATPFRQHDASIHVTTARAPTEVAMKRTELHSSIDPSHCLTLLRRAVASIALWSLGATTAAAQGPAAVVPITSEPSHHLALTTSYVRVFDVTAAPHATTLVHRHDHDYLFVTLGDADITSTRTDRPAAHLPLKDGAIEFAPGGFSHSVTNNSDRPFHNITIELLQPSTGVATCTDACAQPTSCTAHCATVTHAITADQWVASTVTLDPGATWTADAAWSPRLAVVVTDADLQIAGEYESTADRHRSSGNLIWMPARTGRRTRPGGYVLQSVTPAIKNVGGGRAVVVVVQWKRGDKGRDDGNT
jgi:quercetin dioxygenase-like cupin family protein